MDELLSDLTIGVAGDARPLRIAARVLSDLGARVIWATEPTSTADRLWLSTGDVPSHGPAADVVLRHINDRGGAQGGRRVTVIYSGASSIAKHAQEVLSERDAAAVGGIAIAIGEPNQSPLPMPEGAIDTLIGIHLAGAALAAVLDEIDNVEVAAADVAAWVVGTNVHLYEPYGLPWFRAGRRASGSGSCYPYALFEAADGLFCMIGRTDRDWQALLSAMGNPDWSLAPAFGDPRALGQRYPERADEHVNRWTRARTRSDLMQLTAAVNFAAAPVLRPEEVLADPALVDQWLRREHEGVSVKVPGSPLRTATVKGAVEAKPLSDLLVLDVSWVWSGPAVSVALADLGATVVKIESEIRPDNTRLRGAALTSAPRGGYDPRELVPYFHALNRGKKSISLNLREPEARAALGRLAAQADVIIENLSPGVMDRFGIPPKWVHRANPGCVFLSMRGYGEHESTAGLRAYAPALSSKAGLEALTAYPGAEPTGSMTVAFADALSASYGVLSVLAALRARQCRGEGAELRLSQFEVALFANGHNLVAAQIGSTPALVPFDEAADTVSTAGALPSSPWVSPDLFSRIRPPGLDGIDVCCLPWRRDGAMPSVGGSGPHLGQHSAALIKQFSLSDVATRTKGVPQAGAVIDPAGTKDEVRTPAVAASTKTESERS